MSVKNWIKTEIQAWSARLGYPMMPSWKLKRLEQSTHIRRLFDLLDINCVLDVGANIGQYHDFMRVHADYHGRMVSFEPVQEMYRRLVEASSADPKWDVQRLALGEESMDLRINVLEEETLTSFLPRNESGLRAMGYEKYLKETELARVEEVPVKRLDEIFSQIVPDRDARVFLKSDTQGYDMKVIRGAAGCLDRISALQIELAVREVYVGAPTYLEGITELTSLGFELTGLFPVQRDSTLRVVNMDCVMIRASHAARVRAARGSTTGN